MAIAVGFGILFAGNIPVIMADVAYHSGVGYETAAGQLTTTTIQAQAASIERDESQCRLE